MLIASFKDCSLTLGGSLPSNDGRQAWMSGNASGS